MFSASVTGSIPWISDYWVSCSDFCFSKVTSGPEIKPASSWSLKIFKQTSMLGFKCVVFELWMIPIQDWKHWVFMFQAVTLCLSQIPDGTGLNSSSQLWEPDIHILHYLWSTVCFLFIIYFLNEFPAGWWIPLLLQTPAQCVSNQTETLSCLLSLYCSSWIYGRGGNELLTNVSISCQSVFTPVVHKMNSIRF